MNQKVIDTSVIATENHLAKRETHTHRYTQNKLWHNLHYRLFILNGLSSSCYKIIIAIILPNKFLNDSETMVKRDIIYTTQVKKNWLFSFLDHKQKAQFLSCVLVLNYGINTKGWKEQERTWFARSWGSIPLAVDGQHTTWGPVPSKGLCVWMARLFPPDQRGLGKSLAFPDFLSVSIPRRQG